MYLNVAQTCLVYGQKRRLEFINKEPNAHTLVKFDAYLYLGTTENEEEYALILMVHFLEGLFQHASNVIEKWRMGPMKRKRKECSITEDYRWRCCTNK